MYQSILAATDGSDLATAAVKHAASIAGAFNAQLTIVSVALQAPVLEVIAGNRTMKSMFDEIRRASLDESTTIAKNAAEIAGPGARTEIVEFLNAYEGILSTAKKVGADLIVMGSHSRSLMNRLVLGSQASKVVNLSEVPVLIVK